MTLYFPPTDLPLLVGATGRITLLGLVATEIVQRERSRIVVRVDFLDHRLGNCAAVEGACPMSSDGIQRFCKLWVFEQRSDRQWFPFCREEVLRQVWRLGDEFIGSYLGGRG